MKTTIKEIDETTIKKIRSAVLRKSGQMAGYVENVNGRDLFYTFPEYFENVIIKGRDPAIALKILHKFGVLELNENGDYLHTITVDGLRQSFYVINSNIFGALI